MATEYEIYDSNGHFHSGPYEGKAAATKAVDRLNEQTAAEAARARPSADRVDPLGNELGPPPPPADPITFEVRKAGADAIAVETVVTKPPKRKAD